MNAITQEYYIKNTEMAKKYQNAKICWQENHLRSLAKGKLRKKSESNFLNYSSDIM